MYKSIYFLAQNNTILFILLIYIHDNKLIFYLMDGVETSPHQAPMH
jgi:hypothetical protein